MTHRANTPGMRKVTLYLTPEELESIDSMRGADDRSTYIAMRLAVPVFVGPPLDEQITAAMMKAIDAPHTHRLRLAATQFNQDEVLRQYTCMECGYISEMGKR